jgi:cytochrome b
MSKNPNVSNSSKAAYVAVWDPVVRITHWALAAGFLIAYFSPEEGGANPGNLHVWAGYALGAIVLLRVLWGFVGPRYARFSDFVFGPTAVVKYLIDLVFGHPRRYLGHSPAGGAMVVALLVTLAASVVTGVAAYGDRGKGPLANGVTMPITRAYAESNEAGPSGSGSVIGELHGAITTITLILVILHIVGVVVASVMHRENLVTAMISGKKPPES